MRNSGTAPTTRIIIVDVEITVANVAAAAPLLLATQRTRQADPLQVYLEPSTLAKCTLVNGTIDAVGVTEC